MAMLFFREQYTLAQQTGAPGVWMGIPSVRISDAIIMSLKPFMSWVLRKKVTTSYLILHGSKFRGTRIHHRISRLRPHLVIEDASNATVIRKNPRTLTWILGNLIPTPTIEEYTGMTRTTVCTRN